VDSRGGMDDMQKLTFLTVPGLKLRPLGCPARSQSLYRLRYRGSAHTCKTMTDWRYKMPHSSQDRREEIDEFFIIDYK
jgi:hypothetical protein